MRQMEALLRGVGPNLPSHWGLIRPVVHNLHVDSEAGQIASQHQAGRAGAHDADLTLEGGLGHVPEQREAVGALGVDFILGLAHLVRVGHFVCCWRHDGGVWGGGGSSSSSKASAGGEHRGRWEVSGDRLAEGAAARTWETAIRVDSAAAAAVGCGGGCWGQRSVRRRHGSTRAGGAWSSAERRWTVDGGLVGIFRDPGGGRLIS